ncbi:MAG: GNAT family N-acetyltransferase [Promethearchaeota archaeon]
MTSIKDLMNSNMFKILEVEFTDLEEIYLLNREIFGDDCIKRDWLKDFYIESLLFLKIVQEADNKIIGAISVLPDINGRLKIAYISMLYIHPSFQGKGLGTYLLENRVIPFFIQRGFNVLELNTKENTPLTTKFYKKMGFQIIRKIIQYYRSGNNCFVMRKMLKQ